MNIKNNLVIQGNFLFRYRSYFPLFLFVISVPFVFFSVNEMYYTGVEIYLIMVSIVISLAGFIIRGYTIGTTPKGTSGRNTKQQVAEQLNTLGIYSMVRHPLYLGNYLIWLGIVVFTYSFSFVIIFSLLYWIYYERIMAAEEDFISKKFPDAFFEWSDKTPAFVPSIKKYKASGVPFSFKSVLRREYSGFLACVISFVYIDYLRCFFSECNALFLRPSLYILLIVLVITLILRSIKHHTAWLNEIDRS